MPVNITPKRSTAARMGWLAARPAILAAALVGAAHLAILATTRFARRQSNAIPPPIVPRIRNGRVVDDLVWRGGAPDHVQRRALAAAGVTRVIDLRLEPPHPGTEPQPEDGLEVVSIPLVDGHAPDPDQVAAFLDAMNGGDTPDGGRGVVFVHCAAGVGRTGSMLAARQVARGGSAGAAVAAMMAVGPPSLEQIVFAARLGGGVRPPPRWAVLVSRVLDAPRKAFGKLRHRLGD
jgi:hypothetical protein